MNQTIEEQHNKKLRAIAYGNMEVWLNDRRAKIVGYALPFATIISIDGQLTAEYSWDAVARIVNTHKQFKVR